MVIPLCMFWLEGSPDGLVIDPCSSSGKIGTIEMKYPEGKKNHTPEEVACSAGVFFERAICSRKRHVETSRREEEMGRVKGSGEGAGRFSPPPPPFPSFALAPTVKVGTG